MALIGVDVDGIISDFVVAAVEVTNKIWPGRLPLDYQPTDWNFGDSLSAEDWDKVWEAIKATENFWLKVPAYADSVTALARFLVATKGHDIVFVTARSATAGLTVTKQTQLWIESCGIRPHHNTINVLVSAHPSGKVDIYRASGVEYSIDDKTETVIECQALPNHRAALLERPWNQQSDVRWQVSFLQQFLEAIR